ncbi:DHA2 family efflux MFS transporter permease subunit [Nocardioides rotundus]|uniref:DHA2 family efflux MFS transporter permease subunit n=1 Tax=Nocardioides rotundus TaxID=1774216 RepID=UPI001CBB0F0F|nr:DHA2 family efflux MFS transporter permease subunit [Nocardioides rotundus]UAL29028.1 DHA2 family efflux MFS transporter permease subunit [Nocardioides rotundus]
MIPYKWLVAAAFAMALFMEILDMTVLNTALPILGEHFGADTSQLQWLVTGYLISLAIFIPASGWFADRFGDKRTFLFALAVYTGANLWAGAAGSLTELLTARLVQGVGGGLLTPVGTAMLFRAFPVGERARASAMLAIPTTLAPMLGPVLGGYLADEVSWRWIFFLKVPVGVFALIFSALVLKHGESYSRDRFDVVGFLTGGAALATLLVGLDEGARLGWTEGRTLILLGIAVVSGAVFVTSSLRSRAPMVDLSLLKDRTFALGNGLLFPAAGAQFGAIFVVPLLLQTQMGLSATQSGLVTAAQAVGMLVLLPFSGRLYASVGPRRLLVTGFGIIALSQLSLIGVGADTSTWWIRASMFGLGMGSALVVVPLQAATFAAISLADTARATAVFSAGRQVAGGLGVALMATVLTVGMEGSGDSPFDAYHTVFFLGGGIGLLGLLLSFAVRDPRPAGSEPAPSPEAPARTVGTA